MKESALEAKGWAVGGWVGGGCWWSKGIDEVPEHRISEEAEARRAGRAAWGIMHKAKMSATRKNVDGTTCNLPDHML